jgi:hypothetical protein
MATAVFSFKGKTGEVGAMTVDGYGTAGDRTYSVTLDGRDAGQFCDYSARALTPAEEYEVVKEIAVTVLAENYHATTGKAVV